MRIIFGIIFLVLGGALGDEEGAIAGFAFGLLLGYAFRLADRIRSLGEDLRETKAILGVVQHDVDRLRSQKPSQQPEASAAEESQQADEPRQSTASPEENAEQAVAVPPPVRDAFIVEVESPSESDQTAQSSSSRDQSEAEAVDELVTSEPVPDAVDPWTAQDASFDSSQSSPVRDSNSVFNSIISFFTTGNVIVKAGVVVLFFGIAFLLKYAVEKDAFPIELRLAGTALGAVGMLVFGWRLRLSRPDYAWAVQGGAIGVLYLTVFASARLYSQISPGFAFALMFIIVALAGLLAVLQNAKSLAVLGTTGGFLAPILISTGSGSHVALFSYYAVLNAGIFGIAWFRSWRILNWLGFVFTFLIATVWGVLKYRASMFATVEPFLLLFFAQYFIVSILYAHKQPPRLRGYVDGTLVFGLPLIAFSLQTGLVRDFEFGRAYSALGLAAVYLITSRWLWTRAGHGLRVLAEAFLALGVIFATLAVPFALDGHWTAATWSIEGAGLVWIGLRQNRLLARMFGLLLQLGGGLLFFVLAVDMQAEQAILNTAFLGGVFLALAGFVSSYMYDRYVSSIQVSESLLAPVMIMWALLWWFGTGVHEIQQHCAANYIATACILFFAASTYVSAIAAQRLEWNRLMQAGALLVPGLLWMAFALSVDRIDEGPFGNGGLLAWAAGLFVSFNLLWRFEEVWAPGLVRYWHALTSLLMVYILAWGAGHEIGDIHALSDIWPVSAWGLVIGLAMFVIKHRVVPLPWPGQQHAGVYRGIVPGILAAIALLFVFITCFSAGNPRPLSYFPILNPLELVQWILLLAVAGWFFDRRNPPGEAMPLLDAIPKEFALGGLGIAAFALINMTVARSVHVYLGVPWDTIQMMGSAVFQASISIVWGITAMILMGAATRLSQRTVWFAGATILAALVAKLFLVDLSDSGTITRIVSFLGAGIIMMVMGYFSPLPPKAEQEED